MRLIEYSVNKFITIISIFLLCLIFGVVSLNKIPIQLVPTVEKPKITVKTTWSGASPEEIEREIIIRQEDKLKSLEGLELMESTSIENQATITLELKEGRNIESSLIQVSNLLGQVKDIPIDSDKPTIKSISSDRSPIAWFILKTNNKNKNIYEYRDFAEDYIKTKFERVEGVGESGIRGGKKKEVQIDIDSNRIAFLEISLLEIVRKIKENNVDISSGSIEEGKRKYIGRTTGEIKNVNDIKEIVIKESDGNYIKLGDISEIKIGYEDENYIVRHLGDEAIAINVVKETGANTIEVQNELIIAMNELNNGVLQKEGLVLSNVYTDTSYINSSISSVKQNLIIGALLAIVVLLFFLKSIKTTLIIALSIPISTITSFIIFDLMGRTLNLISLAGISFAVGMVVDNSLVVLENIFSKLEKGEKNPFTASINGAKEVGGAILASTLTTFAVFLPILFLSSEIGQLFKDIALAISISVIISFFVSLTFIPGLASRILVADTLSDLGEKRKFFSFFDKISEKIKRNILNLLDLILQKSDKILKYIIIILSTTLLLFFLFFPKIEYLPEGNRNLIISVLIPPQGYNITKIKEIGKKAENKIKKFWNEDYKKDNKIKNFFFVARPKSVFMGAVAENPQKIKELIPEIKKAGEGFPGFITVVNQSSLFSRSIGERRAIDINIQGKEYESIINLSRMIFIKLKNEVPNYQIRPKPSLTNSNPEIIIKPNNLKLNQVNMTTSQLGLITNVILDGAKISKYNNDGKEIDIILRANKPDTISSNMLNTRYIYNDKKLFPLSYVSDISIINSPQQINHVERERTIKLQVSPDEKTNIEEALDEIKKIINSKEIKLYESNNNLQIGIKGIAGKLNEAKSSLSINFIYAILISFFLLSSLFQNFIYPLIVLIIVPLSCLAGIYGLKIMNLFIYEPLNMLSMLGFIILLGIVVNNSILIVYKSINNLRQGMEENESIKEAVKSRIRPIFMTTLTTSFGLLPLAVIPGAGAELYRGLAVIILFGLLISTLFTLFLTPMSILVMNRYFKIK
tara:strand:- start:6119 stop:9220 length:3102 start_codon:yes stop_codon:yes gene_type:complete